MDIQGLLAAYAGSQPKRAHGGIHAMAGFAFQAQVYIARFVRAMASAQNLNAAGQVFVEALSDVAEADAQGDLILLQVKRTLTTTTLDDAAAEMAAIEAVAAARNPAVKPVYGVVCQYTKIDLDWQRLPAASAHRALVARLSAEGRLRTPEVHADPCWDVIATVWPVLRDPWDFYRCAFERAMRRTVDVADAERCRNEISERFEQLRHVRATPGRLLQRGDFDMQATFSGHLEVGKRVTLGRWQAGQYMRRTALAAALATKADGLRQASRGHPDAAMPVLWLAGRSGAGKSVILLNLAAELAQQGARIWWLEPDQLQDAIDYLARNDAASMPDFIAIDDVFDRDAREHLDIGRFSMLMDDLGPRDWPVLVTCGPSEFADDFERDTLYQGFKLHRHELPLLNEQDGQQFVAWAKQHGCAQSPPGDALRQTAQGQGLFVSLATELAYGDLRQFARRFALRVKAKGDAFTRSLRLCLALNRLYLRAPADWLTTDEREQLEALNQDGDFALEATESDQEWMRLTHPHLSNEIYPHLLVAETGRTYAEDLGDVFRKALDTGREGLALRMLRAFAATGDGALASRMRCVDQQRLARLCAQAWQRHSPGGDLRMQAGLHVAWACWRDAAPALKKTPADLLRGALAHVETAEARGQDASAWPAWWLSLWRAHEGNAILASWAVARVQTDEARSLPVWSYIWQQLFALADAAYRPGLVDAARSWLAARGDRGDWHYVWTDLKAANSLPEQALSNLLACALPYTESPHWAHVWQEALRLPPEPMSLTGLLARGIDWLNGRDDDESWSYVWRALLERETDLPPGHMASTLVGQGVDWLSGHDDRKSWSYVWEALLAREAALPAGHSAKTLAARGCDWLNGRGDNESWAYIWQALLKRTADLPPGHSAKTLVAQGCEWLAGHDDSKSWVYVWEVLLSREAELPSEHSRATLIAAAARWLDGHEDWDQWGRLWGALLARPARLPSGHTVRTLVARGCAWLKGREGNAAWTFVWDGLVSREADWPAHVSLDEMMEAGIDWVQRHPEHPSSPAILKAVLVRWRQLTGEMQRNLAGIVAQWAPRCAELDAGAAGHLLEAMIDAGLGQADSAIQRAALAWCGIAQARPSWPLVLVKCLRDVPVDAEWDALADHLAQHVARHPNAGWLYKAERLLSALRPEGSPPGVVALLNRIRQRRSAPQWASVEAWLASGETVHAHIAGVPNRGALVELPGGLFALLEQARVSRFQVGQAVDVKIMRADRQNDRVIVQAATAQAALPAVGLVIPGKITGHQDYGVFFRVDGISGLIMRSVLPADASTWPHWLPVGSEWDMEVLAHTPKGLNAALAFPPWPPA